MRRTLQTGIGEVKTSLVGLSDPRFLWEMDLAQWMKGTPGITGSSPLRVHIDEEVWHLDVDSAYPDDAAVVKGAGVHCLRGHASWVQIVVKQIGFYLLS